MRQALEQETREYDESGFVVVPRLFDQPLIDHFMTMRAEGPKPGDTGGTDDDPDDPNHIYPRMINMHGWDRMTDELAQRADLTGIVSHLIGDEAVLRQTMLYFKPPGGRGQALHQDQQYITIEPLIGVWVALDRSDAAVGRMTVVPGSHRLGILPVEAADTSVFFTDVQAVRPGGAEEEVGIDMNPGDALFFHGKLVHGSYANKTKDRWRRSFICHFVGKHAEQFEPEQGKHVSHLKRDGASADV